MTALPNADIPPRNLTFLLISGAVARILTYAALTIIWPSASAHWLGKLGVVLVCVELTVIPLALVAVLADWYPQAERSIRSLAVFYLSLVATFAVIYMALCVFLPPSVVAISGIEGRDILYGSNASVLARIGALGNVASSCLHFSLVTMATVGFGDMTPHTWYARLIVDFQILVGLFVVIISVGKYFGLHQRQT
jgi:hypothetical protein